MSLDGLAIHVLSNELNQALINARIDKISQQSNYQIMLNLRHNGKSLKLLGSMHPQNARFCLTDRSYDNLPQPPLFCMVLRKHLTNAKITRVYQYQWERIIIVDLQGRNEIGDVAHFHLILELMGKNSNIVLCDADHKILDALRRVTSSVNTYRQIQPGLTYVFPPSQNKLSLSELTEEILAENILLANENKSLEKILLHTISGIGPQSAREIIIRSQIDPQANNLALGEVDFIHLQQTILTLKQYLDRNDPKPSLILKDQEIIAFAPFPLVQFEQLKQVVYPSMSALLESYYHAKEAFEKFQQKRHDVDKRVQHEIDRCQKKLSLQLDTVYAAEESDKYRLYGELLTANLYQVKQGDSADVINFYDPDQTIITIPMRAEKTPNENAQIYFSKYSKAQKASLLAQEHLEKTQLEIDYLQSIQQSLSQADTLTDLAEIKAELRQAGYIKKLPKQKNKTIKDTLPKPIHVNYEGYDIYIGKNNQQNDYVTFKIGRNSDLWLHTKDIHGSHVIIKRNDNDVFPDHIIEQGAILAAWFSKGRLSANVPVDYTYRKNVHKPSGAPAGKVTYTDQKTVYTTANREYIDELLSRKNI